MIPYEEIQKRKDRSWSFKLLDALKDSANASQLPEITATLGRLDDPRMHAPLTAMLENKLLPEHVRNAASDTLFSFETGETDSDRRRWWDSGDHILMRHAIRMAERSNIDFLEPVASDPNHPFYIDAIKKLDNGFTESRFQHLKIRALSHPDLKVREAAAWALLWDEPVAATEALINAATNDVDSVADEALHALAYYTSKRVLLWLEEMSLSAHPRCKVYGQYLDGMVADFESQRARLEGPSAREMVDQWLKPILHLLGKPNEDEDTEPRRSGGRRREEEARVSLCVPEIIERYGDQDGCWEDLEWEFRRLDWKHFGAAERRQLTEFFLSHPDHLVRQLACNPLQQWAQSDALLSLTDDKFFWVRKMAVGALAEVPRRKHIAPKMWELLSSGMVAGCQASEALGSYIRHAEKKHLDDTLAELARSDQREEVCANAIWTLTHRDARKQIKSLAPSLYREPKITWCEHIALLGAYHRLGIELPDVTHLLDVDNLYLQVELAEVMTD